MFRGLTFIFIILSLQSAYAQSKFQLNAGGIANDEAYSIIQTTDGGYAVAGGTLSFGAGSYDMYIVKFDGSGSLQWSKTVGGTDYDYARSIVQTADGGYAVAGFTWSFGAGGSDMYIVKLDGSGTLQWSKTVGGTTDDKANSIIQTTDGGYAVAGFTTSFGAGSQDMYIVKLDISGTLQWSKTVGGTSNDDVWSIIQTTDGGYAVAGYTQSFGAGPGDCYIIKLNSTGTIQWSRTAGGANIDDALSIVQTTDGGYAVAGYTSSFGAGSADLYIVKLDGSGSLQWSKAEGGTRDDAAYSIIQTTDGGYAVAGYTTSFGAGSYDIYVVKFDGSGSLQWSKTEGGKTLDESRSIIQTTDGGYAVAGYTNSFGLGACDMYIIKFDASGNTCGNSGSPESISGSGGTLGTPSSIINSPSSAVTTPTPNVFSRGTSVQAILCF